VPPDSLQVFYSGHVQGVGFRYAVKQIAQGFEVTGSIRNLADGRVELQASGAPEELTAFLDAIMASGLRAHIQEQTVSPLPQRPLTRGFEIRYE
jgi:acylphosphatase